MPHAYTPGLTVTRRATLRRVRRLPLEGQVLKQVGDVVRGEDVVARTELPGDVAAVNVVNRLGVPAAQIERYMLKKEGDAVREGEAIAENQPLLKWFKTTVTSPITGTVESISTVTGQVMLRKPPKPVEVNAYVDGRVVEVMEGEGVVVETTGMLVQGILGVGGEARGEIKMLVESPQDVLDEADAATEDAAGKVLIAGALATAAAVRKLRDAGAAAVVVGGLDAQDLRSLLGYDLGVAITGAEPIGVTLILTEGFGRIEMARRTFELLRSCEGRRASVNGATQIRAGVLRPEIIAPAQNASEAAETPSTADAGIEVGRAVRAIRAPYFGRLGKVVALPEKPARIETEAVVRIATVEFADGERADIPRANLEAMTD